MYSTSSLDLYLLRHLSQVFKNNCLQPIYIFFPCGSNGKNLPAMLKTRIQPLGWEDPLEKGMASCSSICAWRIPWTEEAGRLKSMGSQRVGQD